MKILLQTDCSNPARKINSISIDIAEEVSTAEHLTTEVLSLYKSLRLFMGEDKFFQFCIYTATSLQENFPEENFSFDDEEKDEINELTELNNYKENTDDKD